MSFDPQTHYQNKNVAQLYDHERFSSLAGRIFQRAELAALKQALDILPPGASLLDAPCGTGRIAIALRNRGFEVTCADISQEMIEVARRRLNDRSDRVQFSRGSAAALPFSGNAFDAVVSMRFMPHFATESRRIMLKEMARVSRRWVVFSNSFSNEWYAGRRALKRWLGHQAPTRYPVRENELQAELRFANLREVGRFWTFRFVSEEVLILCEKTTD